MAVSYELVDTFDDTTVISTDDGSVASIDDMCVYIDFPTSVSQMAFDASQAHQLIKYLQQAVAYVEGQTSG